MFTTLAAMKVVLFHPFDTVRARLAAQLRDAGLDVLAVSGADDLLGVVATRLVGAVVIELLPDVDDGMALLSQCHATDPQLPVVVLCSGADAAAVRAAHGGRCDVLGLDQLTRLAPMCR